MSDGDGVKLYQTKERRPPLRLLTRTWEDSPNKLLLAEEKKADKWERVGSVEIGYGPNDCRGILDDSVVAEWSHTRFHANGDRVRVDRRLVSEDQRDTFDVTLQERREEVLGFGDREEHGWQEQDSWRVEAPQLARGDSVAR